MTCLVCDAPETQDIGVLLAHIENVAALVTLACDFAERAVYLAPAPEASRRWLEATRAWKESPEAAEAASVQASAAAEEELQWSDETGVWYRSLKLKDASQAVAWAVGSPVKGETLEATKWAAIWAANTALDSYLERAWQLVHVRETACTCLVLPDPPPDCPRSRRSLLADPDRPLERLCSETVMGP